MAEYGKWKDLPPGTTTTSDFKDSDGDGVDDRKQDGPGMPAYNSQNSGQNKDATYQQRTDNQYNQQDQQQNQTQGQTQVSQEEAMRQGQTRVNDIMGQFYNYMPKSDDDEGRMMKNTYAMDTMTKFNDMNQAMIMAPFQAGISKDMMNQQFHLEQLGASNARKEEFSYGARGMMLAGQLQNEFANAQYGRDIGTMAAAGEQTRKNYRSQGVENRLGTITEGEQYRLGLAAMGDQERKSYDFKDTIDARKEARQASRARGQARAF